MGQNIKQLNMSKPWGFISRLFGESLITPSAYKLFLKHTVIRKSKGMRCLAVIIEDSDIANTIMSQLTQAYKHAGVDFAFFTDIESAITWLKEHEITLDHQDM